MRKLLLVILFPLLAVSQNTKLDQKNGFDQFKFGSSPSEYKNLAIEIDEGDSKLYSVAGSSIVIDGIEYDYIRITFTKNKLSAISMRTKNSTGNTLLTNLKSSYGEPKFVAKAKHYEWKGNTIQLVYAGVQNNDGVFDFYKLSKK
jgi:hypothetical protein